HPIGYCHWEAERKWLRLAERGRFGCDCALRRRAFEVFVSRGDFERIRHRAKKKKAVGRIFWFGMAAGSGGRDGASSFFKGTGSGCDGKNRGDEGAFRAGRRARRNRFENPWEHLGGKR
ncbi:hypothetical protein, partial [Methylosinus sp. Ce-a6]|uniref:hypothetical protein n=1 Tax=Methylosinus sp. Ce-a6 TaxID=2172005 RepID=UPI001AEE80F8